MGAHFRPFLLYEYNKVALLVENVVPPVENRTADGIDSWTDSQGRYNSVSGANLLKSKGKIVHRESQTFEP